VRAHQVARRKAKRRRKGSVRSFEVVGGDVSTESKPSHKERKRSELGTTLTLTLSRYSFHWGTVRFGSGRGEASFPYCVHVFPFFFVFEASRAMKPRGTHTSETTAGTGESAPRRDNNSRTEQSKVSFVHHSTDPQSDVARARSWAAIYVQDFDAPCVLQFAWISALCCALHRSTSQVIHRSGSYNNDNDLSLFLPLPSLDVRLRKGNSSNQLSY